MRDQNAANPLRPTVISGNNAMTENRIIKEASNGLRRREKDKGKSHDAERTTVTVLIGKQDKLRSFDRFHPSLSRHSLSLGITPSPLTHHLFVDLPLSWSPTGTLRVTGCGQSNPEGLQLSASIRELSSGEAPEVAWDQKTLASALVLKLSEACRWF